MEKAILKTLAYADIFNYPLNLYEIHKWLVGRKANLRQVEKSLLLLKKAKRVGSKQSLPFPREKGKTVYYFLGRREKLVRDRKVKAKQSAIFLKKAKALAVLLKFIPWIKLVGISGGLAMGNAGNIDDIDFFIITAKGKLWVSRLAALGILALSGQRRKAGQSGKLAAGKICLNTILEEDELEQEHKDIYLAHEVLQMKVLWEREGVYSKYLHDNDWVFNFLPNWVGSSRQIASLRYPLPKKIPPKTINVLENLARGFQLAIMKPKQGKERIENGGLYFHPQDCRPGVLTEYKKRLKKIISP